MAGSEPRKPMSQLCLRCDTLSLLYNFIRQEVGVAVPWLRVQSLRSFPGFKTFIIFVGVNTLSPIQAAHLFGKLL